jgi:cytochrome c556
MRFMTHVTRLCCALLALSLAPAVFAGPVVSPKVKPLMANTVGPASEAVFSVARRTPSDDLTWHTVEKNSLTLAEAGKTLKKLTPRKNAVWRTQAGLLIENATAAAVAAKARDINGLNAASEAVFNTCAGCHQAFPVNP